MIGEDSSKVIDYSNNVSRSFFQEAIPVIVRGAHVANIFYTPTHKEKSQVRVCTTIPGVGGSPIEICLWELMGIAKDYGFDVMSIELVKLSATDGSEKNVEDMTLAELRFGIFWAIKHTFFKKIHKKSVFGVLGMHSMANRGWQDLLAEFMTDQLVSELRTKIARRMKAASDERIVMAPYVMPAPGLLETKQELKDKDPTEVFMNKVLERERTDKRKNIIPGKIFPVKARGRAFDIGIPEEWRDAFGNYNEFKKNIVRSLSDDKIDIFAGQEKFIKRVSYTFEGTHTTAILPTNDLYRNEKFTIPLFKKLVAMKPEQFTIETIEGADHYFENKRDEFCNVIDRTFFGLKDKVRS